MNNQAHKKSKSSIKSKILVGLLWTFGAILILTGISNISSEPIPSIFFIFSGIALLPIFWELFKNKTNIDVPTLGKVIVFIALIVIAGSLIKSPANQTDSSQKKQADQAVSPTQSLPTDTPAPTKDPAIVKADYKEGATDVTISDIAKDPNYYKSLTVKFTGTILNFVQDSSGNTSGANVSDPNDYSSIIQVVFSPFVEIQSINKGDTITVWGKGLGSASGTNAFGGTIREGVVQEVYLNDTTSGYVDELDNTPNRR